MEKKCADCNQFKDIEHFQKCKQSKDGHDFYCKPCKAIRFKRYLKVYLSDPEKAKKYKANQTKWTKSNPQLAKEFGHRTWLRLRNAMLDAYGRECACCGETHVEFLTLEHVNRDGSEHRKRVGGGANTYRDLKRLGWPKNGYKVLCMNCNWAIRRGGICPHKQQVIANQMPDDCEQERH